MRSILVTGANRGIGLEFVRQLAQHEPSSVFVFASCRSPDTAKELQDLAATHTNVRILKIDVQNESTYGPAVEEVSSLVGENGLNILINNAGVFSTESYETITREFLISTFEINIFGPMCITKAFLPLLKRGALNSKIDRFSIDRAAVINVASLHGSISLNKSGGAAGSRESKAALNMFTRGLSIELKKDKILVVSQCPGWVSTRLGGPNAPKTPKSSVSDLLQIFKLYSEEHTGYYFENTIPLKFSQY